MRRRISWDGLSSLPSQAYLISSLSWEKCSEGSAIRYSRLLSAAGHLVTGNLWQMLSKIKQRWLYGVVEMNFALVVLARRSRKHWIFSTKSSFSSSLTGVSLSAPAIRRRNRFCATSSFPCNALESAARPSLWYQTEQP